MFTFFLLFYPNAVKCRYAKQVLRKRVLCTLITDFNDDKVLTKYYFEHNLVEKLKLTLKIWHWNSRRSSVSFFEYENMFSHSQWYLSNSTDDFILALKAIVLIFI